MSENERVAESRPEPSPASGVVAPEGEPDYRVSLAAERTYLAYVRTSLALIAAGVAVVALLPEQHMALQRLLAVVLIVFGGIVALEGFRHFRKVDAAVREGRALPRSPSGTAIAVAMAIVAVLALVLTLVLPA